MGWEMGRLAVRSVLWVHFITVQLGFGIGADCGTRERTQVRVQMEVVVVRTSGSMWYRSVEENRRHLASF